MPVPGEDPALDAQTQVPVLIGTSVALLAAAFIVVALRIFTRKVIVKSMGADDIVMIFALVRRNLSSPHSPRASAHVLPDLLRRCLCDDDIA